MSNDSHSLVLDQVLDQIKAEPNVNGVMLQGSVARGDNYPGSDLDLLVLVKKVQGKYLVTDHIDSVFVERHNEDPGSLRTKLSKRPDLAYGIVDGRILRDPLGKLAGIVDYAKNLLAGYVTPEKELEGIRYWLSTTRIKLEAATGTGDDLKVAFLAATSAWKIMEGIWAANDLPMPPSGAVFAHVGDLSTVPDDFAAKLKILFVGAPAERAASSLTLIDWFMTQS